MYHEVKEPAEAWSHLAVSPAAFRQQLSWLREAGYATLTAGAYAALHAAGGPVPPRSVILTFDDGFEDFHRHAVPALVDHGFAGTVFVTTGWIQDAGRHSAASRPGRMLSWSQVAESAAAGMEIGAHSCLHPQLDQIPAAELRDELGLSKERLEDQLGAAVPGVAYPFGYSSAAVRDLARAVGYEYGYAVRNTMTDLAADRFRLPRLTVHQSTSLAEFQRLVSGRFVLTAARDRALTAGWTVLRRARAARPVSRQRG
jgi:peptidoglycan/xylan/chitin deacetylase (PgdA/CDA1 family)